MTKVRTALFLLVSCIVSSVVGGMAGYYSAMVVPVPVPIAVIDPEALAKSLDPSAPDFQQRQELLMAGLRAKAELLTSQGFIVLDKRQVLAAPAAAMVGAE